MILSLRSRMTAGMTMVGQGFDEGEASPFVFQVFLVINHCLKSD